MNPQKTRDDYESVINQDEFFADNGDTEEPCPRCGKKLKWRRPYWRNGSKGFLACSNKSPKCSFAIFPKIEKNPVSPTGDVI